MIAFPEAEDKAKPTYGDKSEKQLSRDGAGD
jgi:hypothetical protein